MKLAKVIVNKFSKFERTFIGTQNADVLTPKEAYLEAKSYIHEAKAEFLAKHEVTLNMEQALYYLYLARSLPKASERLHDLIALICDYSLGEIDKRLYKRYDAHFFVADDAYAKFKLTEALSHIRDDLQTQFLEKSPTVMPPAVLRYIKNELLEDDLNRLVALSHQHDEMASSFDLESDLFECFAESLFIFEHDDERFDAYGLPSSVAMRLAQSYLSGIDVPCDRARANFFLSYALMTGSLASYTIAPLYLFSLDLTDDREIFNLQKLFLNGFCLYTFSRERSEVASLYLLDSNYSYRFDKTKGNIGDDLLYNCLLTLDYFRSSFNIDADTQELTEDGFKENYEDETKYLLASASAYLCHRLADRDASVTAYAALLVVLNLLPEICASDMHKVLVSTKVLSATTPADIQAITLALLDKNPKRDNYYANKAYIESYYFSLNEKSLPQVQYLATFGDGRASLRLGSMEVEEFLTHNEGKTPTSTSLWELGVEAYDGLSCFNRALCYAKACAYDKAICSAKQAIKCNIGAAYFILYQSYLKEDKALAHTYLRLANNYLLKEGRIELQKLKTKQQYSPLPYMEIIEHLEEISEYSPAAALQLALFYSKSGVLPADPFKHFEYMRKSISLGMGRMRNIVADSYKMFFGNCDLYLNRPLGGIYENLTSVYKGSRINQDFVDVEKDEAEVTKLMHKLYNALKAGKSDLERHAFAALVDNDDFAICNGRPPRAFETNYKRELLDLHIVQLFTCLENDAAGADLEVQLFENYTLRLALLEDLSLYYNESDFEPDWAYVRALNALRPLSVPVNYKLYREQIQKAGNAYIGKSSYLMRLCTDAGFASFDRVKTFKASSKIASANIVINTDIQ